MALDLVGVHTTQKGVLILPLLGEVASHFILDVLFVDWNNVSMHLF